MSMEGQAVPENGTTVGAPTRSTITTVAGVMWAIMWVAVVIGLTTSAVSLTNVMDSGKTGSEFAGLLLFVLVIMGIPLVIGTGVATLLTWRSSMAGHIVSLVLAVIAGIFATSLLAFNEAMLLIPVVLIWVGVLVAGSISGIDTARARSAQR